jgi:hypothetical protein
MKVEFCVIISPYTHRDTSSAVGDPLFITNFLVQHNIEGVLHISLGENVIGIM